MHELGDPWTDMRLDDVDAPTPGPGQIGIDVEALGVAFPNVLMAQGKYQIKSTPPFSPAESVVGRVASLGEGVDSFALGDRVMTSDSAVLAEQTVAVTRSFDIETKTGNIIVSQKSSKIHQCSIGTIFFISKRVAK